MDADTEEVKGVSASKWSNDRQIEKGRSNKTKQVGNGNSKNSNLGKGKSVRTNGQGRRTEFKRFGVEWQPIAKDW